MDDFFSSLIPIQEDDPLNFSDTPIHHQDSEVPIINNNICKGKRQPKNPSSAIILANNDNGKNPGDEKQKRVVHRNIERQRRQEMATMCASLRNLLPLEYIKGKRSVSDHVHEAANYIKHMKKNIRELEAKRDKLRNSLDGSSATNSSSIIFTVRPCSDGGIEILVENDLADNGLPLSRILDVLLNEGLNVVSCVSTKSNEKFLYVIQAEATDHLTDVDLFRLQEKLTGKFNNRN
ncbi:hypothetical protein ACH5RR_019622 [Cinchona calisaya]|uniref:BHLH domain-containing protein n=1 Tax=Cinchona calisaya TaxID=153742 RepID=A0ABD2ZQD1_9GENT